ncbi:MAG TPA: LuxR C-terminal-related transcriptional regulator, partial [Pseudonocardia sp.]|nr:LuxR C-terminal-related transcriptional regulator [Pseudonocardia sp.]
AVPHTAGTAVESIAAAVDDAIAAAGQPPWCTAAAQWWRVQRAAATDDADAAAEAAAALRGAAEELGTAHVRAWATAARSWAEVLADRVDAAAVRRAGGLLVVAGSPWEAATLCLTAAHRATDPGVVRELLGAGRGARGRVSSARLTGRDGLSQREREVGRLVLDGLTQREIGARLYISPKTVEQHVARLRQKLAAANRAELVAALRARIPAAPVPPDQTRTG